MHWRRWAGQHPPRQSIAAGDIGVGERGERGNVVMGRCGDAKTGWCGGVVGQTNVEREDRHTTMCVRACVYVCMCMRVCVCVCVRVCVTLRPTTMRTVSTMRNASCDVKNVSASLHDATSMAVAVESVCEDEDEDEGKQRCAQRVTPFPTAHHHHHHHHHYHHAQQHWTGVQCHDGAHLRLTMARPATNASAILANRR